MGAAIRKRLFTAFLVCLIPVYVWAWGVLPLAQTSPTAAGGPVAVTGTPNIDTGYADGNMGVTIPSDATAVVVASWMWRTSHTGSLATLNFDAGGQDFDSVVTNADTSVPYDVFVYIMTTNDGDWPGTGSKTLYWTFSGAPTEGGTVFVYYLKGLDVVTPVVDTDTQKAGASFTSSLTGVVANDMTFGIMAESSGQTITVSGNGQTVLDTGDAENSVDWGVCYESGESAIVMSTTGSSYPGYVAFAIDSL